MKKFIIFISLLSISIVISENIFAQDLFTNKYSPGELKEDLNYFLSAAESIHPNLYHSIDKESIYKYRDELHNEIIDSMTVMEFVRLVSPLSTMLKDGHTQLWFPYQDVNKVYASATRFPFKIKIIEKRIFIINNYSDDANIRQWDEIISINHVRSADLLSELIKYRSGELDHFKMAGIERSFAYYLWLIKGWSSEFHMDLKRDSESFTISVTGLTSSQIKSKAGTTPSSKPYSLQILDGNIALIDFRSMVEMKPFKKFLDSSFQVIADQNCKDLIIDVRKNGGGNSQLGDKLFDYITDQPYKQADNVVVRSSELAKKHFKKQIIKWYMYPLYPLILVNKQANATMAKKNGSLTEISSRSSKVSRNKKNRFHGNVYLLTGPYTYSSAGMFTQTFSCYDMGTIIGEETGQPIVSYGELILFNLPNTNTISWASSKSFNQSCSQTSNGSRGTKPDYLVVPTINNLINQEDVVLEYTLDLINK